MGSTWLVCISRSVSYYIVQLNTVDPISLVTKEPQKYGHILIGWPYLNGVLYTRKWLNELLYTCRPKYRVHDSEVAVNGITLPHASVWNYTTDQCLLPMFLRYVYMYKDVTLVPEAFFHPFLANFATWTTSFSFFYWHEGLRAEKRKPLVKTFGILTFMPSAFDRHFWLEDIFNCSTMSYDWMD